MSPAHEGWFGPLDGHVAGVTRRPSTMPGDHLAILHPGGDPASVRRITADATSYRRIPLVAFSGDESVAAAVAVLPDVERVLPAAAGHRETRPLVEGFDQLMAVAQTQRMGAPGTHDVVGGLDDTPPALMPVVNFSIGTTSVAHPVEANDPVNIATWAASRFQLVVSAAGNAGSVTGSETMSAWAQVPWVLAVGGTADRAGTVLASTSSVGVPGRPDSGPDLVAYGASELDETRTGTSFAAPRVSFCAMLCAAAVLQLRKVWLDVTGHGPSGVPLVGCGVIDTGFDALRRRFVSAPGLPTVGTVDGIDDIVGQLVEVAPAISLVGSPQLLRELLAASARPVAGYGPHQVGAGFVDDALVLDHLASWTVADVLRAFGDSSAPPGPTLPASLAAQPVFDRDALAELGGVVELTGPLWAFDYQRSELGRIS